MESSPSAASCRSSQPPTKVMLDIALVTDISVSMGGPTSQPSSTKAWVRTAMPEKSTQNRDLLFYGSWPLVQPTLLGLGPYWADEPPNPAWTWAQTPRRPCGHLARPPGQQVRANGPRGPPSILKPIVPSESHPPVCPMLNPFEEEPPRSCRGAGCQEVQKCW